MVNDPNFNPNQVVTVTTKDEQDDARILVEELVKDMENNPDEYSEWEDNFICSLEYEENAFSERQIIFIKRVYEKHILDFT